MGVPRYPTATCGMDVLTHALEAYTSITKNPYSASIARGAIEMVANNLRTAVVSSVHTLVVVVSAWQNSLSVKFNVVFVSIF